ncbi:unnamed protein product, partial [Urochloa humidicola]
HSPLSTSPDSSRLSLPHLPSLPHPPIHLRLRPELSGGPAISGARGPDRAAAGQIRARVAQIELEQGRAPGGSPARAVAGAPSCAAARLYAAAGAHAAAVAEQIEEAEPRRRRRGPDEAGHGGSGQASRSRRWGSRPAPLLSQRVDGRRRWPASIRHPFTSKSPPPTAPLPQSLLNGRQRPPGRISWRRQVELLRRVEVRRWSCCGSGGVAACYWDEEEEDDGGLLNAATAISLCL